MILDEVSWMNIRRYRVLHEAGATYAEIARECGADWRTVRKYLAEDGVAVPPAAPSRAGTQPRSIDPFVAAVEACCAPMSQ
jgi:transposase